MAPLSTATSKRGPTVLVIIPVHPFLIIIVLTSRQVTDSREPQRQRSPQERPADLLRRQTSRFITVDSVLQYASDIPSMQQRNPNARPKPLRTGSGMPADPRLAGRLVPQHMPARSTKVSEKLVLLPETAQTDPEIEEKADYGEENDAVPERDDEETLRKTGGRKGKSYAERLPKARRAEKLARVTAYCTAQAYKLKSTAAFLKGKQSARTKLYDDCLYTVYHLPLLPGPDGYRIRSSPVLKSPGGKAILDEEIERSESRDYGEGFFEENGGERFSIRGGEDGESPRTEEPQQAGDGYRDNKRRGSDHSRRSISPPRIAPDAFTFAEMFVFSYGVVVFWNFTERQEKDILADLTFSESETGIPLVTRAQREEDFETEEFHFEYSSEIPRPRVFNDMITLRSGDHMIKLTMSHAIAQSTKLSYFEQQMANQMTEAQHVPRRLALTGTLGLKREEVVKILGALFKSRVEVNLCKPLYSTPYTNHETAPSAPFISLTVSTFTSVQHARHPQLLLGQRTHPPPALHRRARIPRDQTPHPSPQRALPSLPRPS